MPCRRCRAASLDDLGHRVLAQGQFPPDQTVAAFLGDERQNLRLEAVRSRPLAGPAAKPLAPGLGRGDAGPDPLLDQLALELGNAGQDGGHHPPVRGRQIERQAVHRDHRHPPALQLLQRVQEVERAAAPARELGHQHGVDLPGLGKGHHLLPFGTIKLHARAGFLEDTDHLVADPIGERGQLMLLSGTGLVGGRDPAVDRHALSQLNPPGSKPRKPACWLALPLYRTAYSSPGTTTSFRANRRIR